MIYKKADRNRGPGSIPELWRGLPEHGIDREIYRLNFRVEGLEIEIGNLTRQLGEMMRLAQRSSEGEWSRNVLREITLPSFSGEAFEDAGEFLRDIEQYIVIKQIPDVFQAEIISNALSHRAKVWFNAVRRQLNNFNEFCDRFRQEFLSDEIQERKKETWKTEKYGSGSFVSYFYLRVGEANKSALRVSEKPYHHGAITTRYSDCDDRHGSSKDKRCSPSFYASRRVPGEKFHERKSA